MPTLPGPLQETECAGHRVLRVLGRSDSAMVLLGHDGEASEPVVLKVVASTERAGRELEALDRAAGDHVVRVADVADLDGGGVAIVLDRLALGDLASLLFRRARWSLGEVVTVIAPIAQTLHRLHDAGVAHGAVRPSSIVFDAEGAPVLVGFGSATFFPPGLPEVSREGLEGVRADREALRALASRLLSQVVDEAAARARDELRALPPEEVLGWGASRLFDLAAPRPIRFTETDAEPGPPGRLGEPREPDRAPEPATSSSLLSGVLPDVLLDRLQAWRDHPVLDAARRIRSWWDSRSTRSRRLMIATAAVAATVAVAGLAFPAGGPAPEADQVPTETGLSTGEPAAGAGAAPGSSGSAESTVAGDDPLAALSVLLDVRERCYRELSVLCLDAVDQPGSPAYAADRARIDEAQRGAELHLPAQPTGSPSLRERLGDSALVAYGAKEWLMIRGAEGWRIRDMFDVEAPSG